MLPRYFGPKILSLILNAHESSINFETGYYLQNYFALLIPFRLKPFRKWEAVYKHTQTHPKAIPFEIVTVGIQVSELSQSLFLLFCPELFEVTLRRTGRYSDSIE